MVTCFRGRASRLDYSEWCPMFGKRRNQRWLTLTGGRYEITYISASIHDINEIPTAVPMFSTSGNTIRLLRRMLDVRKREKSKMAAKRRDKFDYWLMFGTPPRGFIWRPFEGCKYDITYIFTNAIMFGASVIFILSTLLPVFGYAIWFRKRPTHMLDCVCTQCPRVAEYPKIVSS